MMHADHRSVVSPPLALPPIRQQRVLFPTAVHLCVVVLLLLAHL